MPSTRKPVRPKASPKREMEGDEEKYAEESRPEPWFPTRAKNRDKLRTKRKTSRA